MTELQREYAKARRVEGLTVAEFEARKGLLRYSVFPERRGATLFQRGYFMYRNATPEEELELQKEAGGATNRIGSLKSPQEIAKQRLARTEYLRRAYEKKNERNSLHRDVSRLGVHADASES